LEPNESLEPVLALAQTEKVRGAAVWPLGEFKQDKAAKQLRRFLNDQDEALKFRAAQTLANRKDPEALEVLLLVANDPKSRWRMYTFDSLLKYPNDPRVEKAIKSGMGDMDSQVSDAAKFAFQQLAKLKKRDPPAK